MNRSRTVSARLSTRQMLNRFTRKELMVYAKSLGLSVGRDKKEDVVTSLLWSTLSHLTIRLGGEL